MKSAYSDLYERYNNILKPLISEIEGRLETFAEPLLHSLSSMLDAVALADSSTGEDHDKFMAMANEDLNLSISLSYQYLIFALKEKIDEFEERVPKDIREKLNAGRFTGKYAELKKRALSLIKECKSRNNDLECLNLYREAYENMTETERLINENYAETLIAEKGRRTWFNKVIVKAASILISVVVGYYVGNLLISIWK